MSNYLEKTFDTLSVAEKKRVDAVIKVANDAIELNVNKMLGEAEKHKELTRKFRSNYYFEVETDSVVRKVFGVKKTSRNVIFGYCTYNHKIVLNLAHVLADDIDHICDTILHECAHAVAFHLYGDEGHGKYWKRVCRSFGISDKAKRSMEFDDKLVKEMAKKAKYRLVAIKEDKGEVCVYGTYNRKLKTLGKRGMPNDPATFGQLWLIKTEDFERIGTNPKELLKVAIR